MRSSSGRRFLNTSTRGLRAWRWRDALTAVALASLAAGCRPTPPPPNGFPGETWTPVSAETAGFSRERLAAVGDMLGGDGCVVVRGRMLHTWGKTDFRHDIASAAKPFYTHFTLKALEQELIPSLDDPVLEWAPELADLNEALGYKDRAITFRHLLTQTSGYGLVEPPGAAFAYNDTATGLLYWTLVRRIYQCGFELADEAMLNRLLGDPIGFEDAPTFRHPRSHRGRLRISVRDMARFGLLYLRGGRWMGEHVLRDDLVHMALNHPSPHSLKRTSGELAEIMPNTRTVGGERDMKDHAGCHSMYWWLNRPLADGTRLLPDAPPGTFLAQGYGGRFAMVVIPEYELIAVWFDAFEDEQLSPFPELGRHRVNEAVRALLAARTEAAP
jgi:CubicO group peptidase (beta-lactamase class C family)